MAKSLGALGELIQHPARFVAVLTAIALSIAFMTVTQVFAKTEGDAIANAQIRHAMKADVVAVLSATGADGQPDRAALDRAEKAIADLPEIQASDHVYNGMATLSHGDQSVQSNWTIIPSSPKLRWFSIDEGRLATAKDEVVVSHKAADKLNLKIGDQVKADPALSEGTFTVVGLTPDPGGFPMYLPGAWLDSIPEKKALLGYDLIYLGGPGTNVDTLAGRIRQAAISSGLKADGGADVKTADAARKAAMKDLANGFDLTTNLLWVFGAIALLVGSIIIANTFAILVAQRRRQVGLLRAVGASQRQVWRRFATEAVALGIVGAGLGVLAGVGIAYAISQWITHSAVYGFSLPWATLIGIFIGGVLVTVLAALAPIRGAMKVVPLEALSPVSHTAKERKASRVRGLICGALVLLGAVAAWASLSLHSYNLAYALAASMLLSLGVLFGAPLYVPLLLRIAGWMLSVTGPRAKLAAMNSARNPQRAGATATALMLAVGLITTLLVGTESIKATLNQALERKLPVDVIAMASVNPDAQNRIPASDGFTPQVATDVAGLEGIVASTLIDGGATNVNLGGKTQPFRVAAYPERASEILRTPPTLANDTLYMAKATMSMFAVKVGDTVTTPGGIKLTVSDTQLTTSQFSMVTRETLKKLVAEPVPVGVWAKVKDLNNISQSLGKVTDYFKTKYPTASLDGGAIMKAQLNKLLDMVVLVIVAMLGVAVVIALIGVGNTLGLSVLERTRESALLRALGLQRKGLRIMLLIEAVLLSLVGTLVGIVAGTFMGWLGAKAVMRQLDVSTLAFIFPWWQIAAVIAVATISGILASVLPGRKAATAAPVEALADHG